MEDYREIRNIGELRNARIELRGAIESRRRALELSWTHLKESWAPVNILRLAFKGLTIDLSETVIGLAGRLKDHIIRKWDERKSHRSHGEDSSSEYDRSADTDDAADQKPFPRSERKESENNPDIVSKSPDGGVQIHIEEVGEGEETGNESDTENTDNTGRGETDGAVGI